MLDHNLGSNIDIRTRFDLTLSSSRACSSSPSVLLRAVSPLPPMRPSSCRNSLPSPLEVAVAPLSSVRLSPQVVLGDLGCVEPTDPHHRLVKKLRPSDSNVDVGVTTPQYRPPDVFLGNLRFQEDLDMWSFGCVAAELFTGQPFICVSGRQWGPQVTGKDCIDAIRKTVGLPGQEAAGDFHSASMGLPLSSDVPGVETAASFLDGLPFFERWFGEKGAAWIAAETAKEKKDPTRYEGFHASAGFQRCPAGLLSIIKDCLKWQPGNRLTLPQARLSAFMQPPGTLRIALNMERGKNGTGTIAETDLDPDLLHFLQDDPCWDGLVKKRLDTRATHSRCVRTDEAQKGLKTEIAGIVDEKNPPKCRSLNGDKKLHMIPSARFAAFVRALKKKWRPWLKQLGDDMRLAVARDNMPEELQKLNGKPILEEEFADNAFAYASLQLMEPGARDDGWHTDGGCSLLHAAVTLWGTRTVEVQNEDEKQFNLEQKPGSFYVGTLAALHHNVHHNERCDHTFSNEDLKQQPEGKRDLLIAVMLRSDVFREFRARRIDATPGPVEFFTVVNHVVAEHLANVPVALPDLTDVLDEVRLTSVPQDIASTPTSGRRTAAPTPRSGASD